MSGGLQNYQPFHSALKLFSITIGTALQVPRVNAGGTAIEWADQTGGSGAVATDTIWDAVGDLVVGTGANTAARLAKGTALQTLRVNAGATALEWATNSISTIVGVSSTKAQFDTACSDGNFLYVGDVTTNATHTGDVTGATALTLATVNSNVGSFGSATTGIAITVNEKGLITAVASGTIMPAVGSITGFGTGVGSALAIAVGSSGGPVTNGGALGTPSSGTLTNCTFPTLNQSTTGSAASLTTARSIYGNNFNGTADLSQIIASTFGGTGNGFTKFSGPTTTERTKTLRNANDTIVEVGGSYTITGTWTNVTLVTPALGLATYTNMRIEIEIINTISANAKTVDLTVSNHQTLTLAAATGAVTITLTPPASSSAGTLVVLQDDTARDITWSSSATILWAGTQPTWASDTASSYRVISWRYDGTRLFLAPTDEFTANS